MQKISQFLFTRSQFITETLAASVPDGPDSSKSAVETDDKEHTVLLCDIPWGGSMSVLQRKYVKWRISLRGKFVSKTDKTEEPRMDASFHYQR